MTQSDPQALWRAQLDQMGAALADLAPALVQYHQALTTAGLSTAMADQLLRDWHWLQWCRAWWPNAPHAQP